MKLSQWTPLSWFGLHQIQTRRQGLDLVWLVVYLGDDPRERKWGSGEVRERKEKTNKGVIMSKSFPAVGNWSSVLLGTSGNWTISHSHSTRGWGGGAFITDFHPYWLRFVPRGVCSLALLGHACSTPRQPALEMERAPMWRSREIQVFEVRSWQCPADCL